MRSLQGAAARHIWLSRAKQVCSDSGSSSQIGTKLVRISGGELERRRAQRADDAAPYDQPTLSSSRSERYVTIVKLSETGLECAPDELVAVMTSV
jgi:hypothetical protein